MFLELLVATLRTVPHVEVVATASTVRDGIEAVERHRPDLGIFDLVLPDGNGLKLLRRAKEISPGLECILLTAQVDLIRRTRESCEGCRAVVDKVGAFDNLLREVDCILREKRPSLLKTAAPDPRSVLTPRELGVFHLIGMGLLNKQIAGELRISQGTVESHRKSICRKLGTCGSELVRVAAFHGQRLPPQAQASG